METLDPLPRPEPSFPGPWAGPVAILVASVTLLVHTWLKWPDVLIDYGQQLYVAWRLAEGDLLYRDIAYLHGPLSSYLHAGAMHLWGDRLLSLVVFNLLVLTALITLIYQLLTHLADRLAATAACLVFVGIFAFAQYLPIGNYNYVTPYTSETTHGLTLALGAVYCWIRRFGDGRARWTAGAGFLTGLVFLTKAEVFVALMAATLVAVGIQFQPSSTGDGRTLRHRGRTVATFFGTAWIGPGAAWLFFLCQVPAAQAFGFVTTAFAELTRGETTGLTFFRVGMGFDTPWVHLGWMAKAFLWQLLLLAPAAATGWFWHRARRGRWALLTASMLPLLVAASSLDSLAWFEAPRAWPFVMMILIAAGGTRLLHRPTDPRARGIVVTAVFALALAAKILLKCRVFHYGFLLSMPATLLVVTAWTAWMPAWIERRGGHGGPLRAVASLLIGIAIVAHLLVTVRQLDTKTHLVGQAGDAFWSDPRGAAVDAFVRAFRQVADADATLLVVPDGIMLNYLVRAETPTRYVNFMPPEVFAYGEERLLEAWRSSPPDFVALVDRNSAEFGYRYFGQDYGRELQAWIDAHYLTVGTIGAPPMKGQGFGIELRARRPPEPRAGHSAETR